MASSATAIQMGDEFGPKRSKSYQLICTFLARVELTLAALAKQLGVRAPSLYKHVDGLCDLQREVAMEGTRRLLACMALSHWN